MFLSWLDSREWTKYVAQVRARHLRRRRSKRVHRPALVHDVASDLSVHYEGFVGYHGCRPRDVASYYREGLRCHDDRTLEECRATVREITGLPSEEVEAAIRAIDRRHDAGCAYLTLDPRELLQCSSHYLIYGSEFTMAVLTELTRRGRPNWQYRLRERGRPTLLRCHIPFRLVEERYIREIAESLVAECLHLRWRVVSDAPSRDHGVILHQNVPRRCVVGHDHPERLPDWHDGGRVYTFAP